MARWHGAFDQQVVAWTKASELFLAFSREIGSCPEKKSQIKNQGTLRGR